MHDSFARDKFPGKLGGEGHQFHAHAKSMPMRRHERPKALDVHVKKKCMLEKKSKHEAITTENFLYMRNDSRMICMPCHGARMRHASRDVNACAIQYF